MRNIAMQVTNELVVSHTSFDPTNDSQLGYALVEIAKARFGTDDDAPHETNEQYLFGLLCDVVKVYSAMHTDGTFPRVADATELSIAMDLGAVVANICPGWIVTDDRAIHS